MDDTNRITITNIPEISAIYFALLQCGYDFYSIERSAEHIRQIEAFYAPGLAESFFCETKQSFCEVYPYWPRAAMLESAVFYLNFNKTEFAEYTSFQRHIMSASNISDSERNQVFWDWVENFPQALRTVMCSSQFGEYFEWERQWIQQQNEKYRNDMLLVQNCLNSCKEVNNTPVKDIQIVLSPIKCVYSSDYHMINDSFIFSSGDFKIESVIHEFLHHVIHPSVMRNKEKILKQKRKYDQIDNSYYLSGNDSGQVNAFEEFAVRQLTQAYLNGTKPQNLDTYVSDAMSDNSDAQ